jgi:hypothetical protein
MEIGVDMQDGISGGSRMINDEEKNLLLSYRVTQLEEQVEVMKKSIILLTREKTNYNLHEEMYDLKPLVNKELMR